MPKDKSKRQVNLTPDEVRFLVSLLEGEAARQAHVFAREQQVRAELLIGKLEGRYK